MRQITKEAFEDATNPVSLHTSRAYYKNNDMTLLVRISGSEYYMFESIGKHYYYYKLTKEEYEAKERELQNTCDKF